MNQRKQRQIPLKIWQYINSKSKTKRIYPVTSICQDPTDPKSSKVEGDEQKANNIIAAAFSLKNQIIMCQNSSRDKPVKSDKK
ncbi:hypothetical protein DPMN_088169 [Dreissena polymorpha]|uniref:Uncharacterized protein n=1 Tax=Dreissena polymorpha TaxID=45954 RepID=A0A9D4QWA0_DREPO|nr:hypothetical protein DPMN_088169 [Dreissena polymorpha]